jgi:O-6-methylguanine DNA methyltransferase
MADQGFALFDTEIGRCGIAWNERGIAGVQLPEARESATRTRLRKRFPDAVESAPSPPVLRAQAGIVALLRGEPSDLSGARLDMSGVPPFHARVYEAARRVPPGATLSYGEIAKQIGSPGSARAVGQALGRNPFAIIVPCHRVLAAGGKLGGFTAEGGVTTKQRMLAIEGATKAVPAPAREDGLLFDPRAAMRHLRRADDKLARLIASVGPCRMSLKAAPSLFYALSEAITYQQLNARAAQTIFGRVQGLFPRAKQGATPKHVMRASDEALRGAGLSRSKLLALRDLAEKAHGRAIPTFEEARALPDDEIVERLTSVRGIGRWTAEMFLMFHLGRPDVLPVDDYGVRKGFAVAFRKRALPKPKDLLAYGERWRPYRTAASWYLWRAADGAAQG